MNPPAVILIFVGCLPSLISIAYGIHGLVILSHLRSRGVEVMGICKGHIWERSGKTDFVEYRDASGEKHILWVQRICLHDEEYPVLYDPEHPERASLIPVRFRDASPNRQPFLIVGIPGFIIFSIIVIFTM